MTRMSEATTEKREGVSTQRCWEIKALKEVSHGD